MQNILATIGIETDREKAETLYNKYIVEELSLISGVLSFLKFENKSKSLAGPKWKNFLFKKFFFK